MDSVGGRIRQALDLRGWSAAGLARAMGTGSGVVSKWLSGEQEPSAESLAGVCRVLRISGHWLLTDEQPMEPPGRATAGPYEIAAAQLRGRVMEAVARALDEPTAAGAKDPVRETLSRQLGEVLATVARWAG